MAQPLPSRRGFDILIGKIFCTGTMRTLLLCCGIGFWALGGTQAQTSCVDCHTSQEELAVSKGDPRDVHLSDFRETLHYRTGVGCQACHGGDGSSYNKWVAHRGVDPSQRSSSRTHVDSVPETCGSCHGTLFAAFAFHEHYELFLDGDRRSPTCTTCHGAVGGSAIRQALPTRCGVCHSDDPDAVAEPVGERAEELQRLMGDVRAVRRKVQSRIERIKDSARRHDLDEGYYLAEASYLEATDDGHGFRWDDWREKILETQEAFDALLAATKKR